MGTQEDVKVNVVDNLEHRSFWQLGLYTPQGVECDYPCVHGSYDQGNNVRTLIACNAHGFGAI